MYGQRLLIEYKNRGLHEVPDGYKAVTVFVTEAEYARLRKHSARLAEGTVAAAMRDLCGLPEFARGLKKVLKDAIKKKDSENEHSEVASVIG